MVQTPPLPQDAQQSAADSRAAPVNGTAAQAPVFVFDSGVGGLSVLRSLLAELPDERFVYLADSAHVPYGDRPQTFIVERTLAIARYAREACGAKAFVIACNTATAAAVAQVRAHWPDWVVVGIEPAVKPAALQTRTGVIGILATSNTLASERFSGLVEGFASDCRVVAQPCPGLVECIEAGDIDGPDVRRLLTGFVGALVEQGADVIVLGCTHYPFVAPVVQALAGPAVQVLETGEAVARETRRRLTVDGLLAESGCGGLPPLSLLATGSVQALQASASRLLGLSVLPLQVAC